MKKIEFVGACYKHVRIQYEPEPSAHTLESPIPNFDNYSSMYCPHRAGIGGIFLVAGLIPLVVFTFLDLSNQILSLPLAMAPKCLLHYCSVCNIVGICCLAPGLGSIGQQRYKLC